MRLAGSAKTVEARPAAVNHDGRMLSVLWDPVNVQGELGSRNSVVEVVMIMNDRYGRSCFMSFLKLDSALNPSSRQVICCRKPMKHHPKTSRRCLHKRAATVAVL